MPGAPRIGDRAPCLAERQRSNLAYVQQHLAADLVAKAKAFLRDAALGERLGPGIDAEDVPGAIESIVQVYLGERREGEEFIQTVRRAGLEPFKAGFTAYIASRQAATEAAE